MTYKNMGNTIHITVTGPYNSGKTAISQEIVDTLRKLGLAVKWEVKPMFETEQDARITGVERLEKLETLSDTTTVVIKEVTVKKDFNSVLNAKVIDHVEKKKR
jgi:Ni2+-binding GTPase involved in maturation of urease and hydrogenase